MNETPEEYKQRIAEAELAFARNEERARIHTGQIQTFSSDAMKAPGLVSAAGVAAALGFYSANYTRLAGNPENLEDFNGILFWLFLSLLLTVCAPGLAYFSQIAYVASLFKHDYSYVRPYLSINKKTRLFGLLGDVFRWGCVLIVLSSIACLVRGGVLFLSIIARS